MNEQYKAGVFLNNDFFFYDSLISSICRYRLKEGENMIDVLCKTNLFNFFPKQVFLHKSKLLFFDKKVKSGVLIYDIDSRNYELISLDVDNYNGEWKPVQINSRILLLPEKTSQKVCVLDIEELSIIKKYYLPDPLSDKEAFEIRFPTLNDNKLSLSDSKNQKVYIIDINQNTILEKTTIEGLLPHISIVDNNKAWFFSRSGDYAIKENGKLYFYRLNILEITWCFSLEKYICVTSENGRKIVFLNKLNNETIEIEIPIEEMYIENIRHGSVFSTCVENDDWIILVPRFSMYIFCVSKADYKLNLIKLRHSAGTLAKKYPVLIESHENSLVEFTNLL